MRQANAAVALLRLNHDDEVWPRLAWAPDPRLRSQVIHRAGPYHAAAELFIKRLDKESDVTIRRALILALGEFDLKSSPEAVRQPFTEKLLTLYRDDDPGIHGAAEWLLRKWDRKDLLEKADQTVRHEGRGSRPTDVVRESRGADDGGASTRQISDELATQ